MLTNKQIGKLSASVAAVVLGLSGTSFGALLVDFKPNPNSPDIPEVKYDAGAPKQLQADTGAQGNSDIVTAGGLQIETPVGLLSLPPAYGISTIQNVAAGTTSFFDVTMVLNGLVQLGAVSVTPITPGPTGITLLTQPLTPGEFELWSFDPVGPDDKILLLGGTIENAVISGLQGKNTGAVFSADINYTSGLIYNQLVANGGTTNGELSWSLLQITPSLGVDGQTLNDFTANMVGQFSTPVIPEPASLSLLALAGLGLARRRR